MKKMSAKEYEDYVEKIVTELDFWKSAKVFRNKKYAGVRQTGNYEIDIALELFLTELVSFRLIVECKNHDRPVTRPIVQQLAQTRDAINAQKAAIASPVGFTKESVDVAKDLGIALWVIAKDIPMIVVMAYEGLKILSLSDLFYELRMSYLSIYGITKMIEKWDAKIINFSAVSEISQFSSNIREKDIPEYCNFYRVISSGSAYFTYANHPLFDKDCAIHQIMTWVFEHFFDYFSQDSIFQEKVKRWEDDVINGFKNQDIGEKAIMPIMNGEWLTFYNLFRR